MNRKDLQPQKTDILITNLTGRFATNIVDDLVIIHHQTTKSSMIFDINLSANEINEQIKFHLPIISKCTIRPYKINNVIDYDLCKLISEKKSVIFSKLNYSYLFLDRFTKLGNISTKHNNRCKIWLSMVFRIKSRIY